jgi:S1-C subfamily serine protease
MTSNKFVYTDASGRFLIDHVLVGDVGIMCSKRGAIAWASATVAAGKSTHVDLAADPDREEDHRPADSGLSLENQLADVVVDEVEPGSPAAKAGVRVGDIVARVGNDAIGRNMAAAALAMIEDDPGAVTLVLERDDKQLSVTLKLDAPAP